METMLLRIIRPTQSPVSFGLLLADARGAHSVAVEALRKARAGGDSDDQPVVQPTLQLACQP